MTSRFKRLLMPTARSARLAGFAFWLSVQGCAAKEGALLARDVIVDAGLDTARPGARAVRPNMSLQYQINGTVDAQVDAQLFVIDLFDSTAAQVAELHAAGRVVIAYVSVGSLEPGRDDTASFPSSAVGAELASYSDERWLDIRNVEVRTLMQRRLGRAPSKKASTACLLRAWARICSARVSTSRRPINSTTTRSSPTSAHTRNLSIGLSEDFVLDRSLIDAFDWALLDRLHRGQRLRDAGWLAGARPSRVRPGNCGRPRHCLHAGCVVRHSRNHQTRQIRRISVDMPVTAGTAP